MTDMTTDQDLSAATADMAKSKPEPHWPVGLYAPGKYFCTCIDCGQQHIAAKRALHCADCTIQRLFNRIATDGDKMDAVVADHLADVQAAVAKAVEAERAECAEIARRLRDQWRCANGFEGFATGAKIIDDAIRSRGGAG